MVEDSYAGNNGSCGRPTTRIDGYNLRRSSCLLVLGESVSVYAFPWVGFDMYQCEWMYDSKSTKHTA